MPIQPSNHAVINNTEHNCLNTAKADTPQGSSVGVVFSMPIVTLLKQWENDRLLTPLDRHFALEMARLHPEDGQQPLFMLLCALLSQQLSSQHSCLVLAHLNLRNPLAEQRSHCEITLTIPALNAVLMTFSAIGDANSNRPLILERGRLYLQRYHQYETQVANALTRLASMPMLTSKAPNAQQSHGASVLTSSITPALAFPHASEFASEFTPAFSPTKPAQDTQLRRRLDSLFPAQISENAADANADGKIDWQKVATATALGKKLAVITGGPGTGKTTTVTKLLLLLQLQSQQQIRLVAPTGKAAARLSESIKASKARLAQSLGQQAHQGDLLAALATIPEEAETLHRLLGVMANSSQFRHHQGNPLRLDLLIVDEASMVDLPMMYKVLSALPEHASLILLGDQDQLASVEAGAVLADICAGLKVSSAVNSTHPDNGQWQMRYSPAQAQQLSTLTGFDLTPFISPSAALGDSLCMLQHSHRFKDDAGIGRLATAVNRADLAAILQVWQQGYQELYWLEHSAATDIPPTPAHNVGLNALLSQAINHYGLYLQLLKTQVHPSNSVSPHDVIEQFNQYRILCAMRAGDYGVEGMNMAVTRALTQAKLIQPQQEFYLGRPLIIQSNDYNLGLFNGDIGLILADADKPERLMAHFIKADGSLLKVLPARLPSHETCYAMTVHKSQGSEFSHVALVLPPSPSLSQWQLLTKELIYTAITRAKVHFTCLGNQHVFERATRQATRRASGLAYRLWQEE